MRKRTNRIFVVTLAAAGLLTFFGTDVCNSAEDPGIRLIVRADDIGSSHAANVACIQSCREGIARSLEVMVPAPWFNEAEKMLCDNPKLDVGVHLTLTSEWENMKWGPVTEAPSLVDDRGHFYPTTSQRRDSPANTGFLQAGAKLDEVESELRAQIELALEKLPNVTHLTCHMGTASATTELRALVEKLADEYRLPLGVDRAQRAGRFGGKDTTAEQKEQNLVRILEDLKPGLWLIIEHPGLDTPEMRAIGHRGYEDVAEDRQGVTRAFTSPRVKEVIRRRGIRLVSYGDVIGKRSEGAK
ncbi:MAG: polysaccharide deacetylase family protein [Planctomycetes bacterium]|nr:polysaccharide deacetylase family protein [Planctomycetota bacterium]MBL7039044.1 polysaccharide deacetylase family protein [Pirellulaceae bacterium]